MFTQLGLNVRSFLITSIAASVFGLSNFSHCPAAESPLLAPAPGTPITGIAWPGAMALGDLNGDHKTDLVVASGQGQTITALLGKGDGQFSAAPGGPVSIAEGPHELVVGDINNDGKVDVASANHDTYNITLMLGDGRGGFTPAPNPTYAMKTTKHPHTHGLGIGDLNHDGNLDLVTANQNDSDIAVALGDGHGGFTPAPSSPIAVGKSPYPLTVGDVNGDGHLDVIATNTGLGPQYDQNVASTRVLHLLLNDGKANFKTVQVPLRTVRPWFAAIGDLNGDHHADIVTTHTERNELTVLLGDANGKFTETSASPIDLGHGAWFVSIADINSDKNADVIASGGDGLSILLGDGKGGLRPGADSRFVSGYGSWQHVVGDVNGDGKPDVAASSSPKNQVTILLSH